MASIYEKRRFFKKQDETKQKHVIIRKEKTMKKGTKPQIGEPDTSGSPRDLSSCRWEDKLVLGLVGGF